MAQSSAPKNKKSAEELKDEKAMKENYKLMLNLGMVEMVHDLDLLNSAVAPQADVKKEEKK